MSQLVASNVVVSGHGALEFSLFKCLVFCERKVATNIRAEMVGLEEKNKLNKEILNTNFLSPIKMMPV